MGFTNKDSHRHSADYETDMYTGITTFHGLVRIYNSKTWLSRLFWISIVIIAYTVFIFQAFSLLAAYRGRPTNYESNIRVPTKGIQFPSVTVCNFSPVKLSNVQSQYSKVPTEGSNSTLLRYLLMSYMSLENFVSLSKNDMGDSNSMMAMDEEFLKYNDTINGTFNFHDFFKTTGFSCNDTFKACSFGGFAFNCCMHTQQIMTDVGSCWKFSQANHTNWRQYVSGQSYGLEILMDANTDNYPVGRLPHSEKGIRYYVHRDDEVPQMSSKGIAVSPGRVGYGAVRLTSWDLLPRSDWGVCQANWTAADIPDALKHYTLSNCELNCLANFFERICGCVPIKYHFRDKHQVCRPNQLITCFQERKIGHPHNNVVSGLDTMVVANTTDINHAYWYNCSGVECGVECDRQQYETLMSYTDMQPSLSFLPQFRSSDPKHARENFVMLKIFFQDILYEEHVQQRALDATTILSNIGGNTGMFLGMSVITLAEILTFFVKWTWSRLDSQRHADLGARFNDEKGQPPA